MRPTCSEQPDDRADGDAHTTDARPTAHDGRILRDAGQVHLATLAQARNGEERLVGRLRPPTRLRQRAASPVFRLLKPGGFFVSSTVCLGGSWVPYRALLSVMRALGKAPSVQIFSKQTLEHELRRACFVDISQPDVGAKPTIAFMVAKKPG